MTPTPDLRVKILILGGGLTGLSAAYHLEQKGETDYLLAEKNPYFGGLCASEEINGFTFDFSGHLLHLRDPYALRLVRKLLRGNLAKLRRNACIWFDGKRIPFPFQAHLWALPEPVRLECLSGARRAAQMPQCKPKNFEAWCLNAFGAGIYKHFMLPYNRKLWQTHPRDMVWDWCGPFVPKPNLHQIESGARCAGRQRLGYNAFFYYPLRGGCGALAQALAGRVPNTWLNAQVQHIDFTRRLAVINGQTVRFERVLNTLPLKDFIALCPGAPRTVRATADKLRHTTVHILNFAVGRKVEPFSWMYFPQPDVPFYRIGLQSGFSPYNAPEGTSSFYVESAEKITDFHAARRAAFNALKQKGIIREQDKILFSYWREIRTAYAVYDANRAKAVNTVLRWLEKKRCFCAGRYGLWEYSFMERSLLQGRDAADKLLEQKL